MSSSDERGNPLYPFNWRDAMRAAASAPPNLPFFGPGPAVSRRGTSGPVARTAAASERLT